MNDEFLNNNNPDAVEPKLNVTEYTEGEINEAKPYEETEERVVAPIIEETIVPRSEVKTKKAKKEKTPKQKRFMPKVVAAMFLGLLFGTFAAGGFYGVSSVLNKQEENKEADSQYEDIEKVLAELQASADKVNTGNDKYATTEIVSTVVTDVTDVVDKVMPAMVSVTNVYEETISYWGRPYTQEKESCGSGIIVGEGDNEYFIATNYHVIDSAKTLSVTLVDGTEAKASIKGYVADIDIAVISIKKSDLEESTRSLITVAKMGDSDSLKMGEPAIAIGNALGYGQSVTTGVISALNRSIDLENSSSSLIQTSAAINPGNSGGALLNIKGEVIGINSSKIGATTVEGIGFAIPIDEVKDIIGELSARVTRDKVSDDERGYLGIEGTEQEIDLTLYGYPAGAYVMNVTDNSPAAAAGLYARDIITAVDGQSVTSFASLKEALSYYKSGETVTLTVSRVVEGALKEYKIDVVLGTREVITSSK